MSAKRDYLRIFQYIAIAVLSGVPAAVGVIGWREATNELASWTCATLVFESIGVLIVLNSAWKSQRAIGLSLPMANPFIAVAIAVTLAWSLCGVHAFSVANSSQRLMTQWGGTLSIMVPVASTLIARASRWNGRIGRSKKLSSIDKR